MISDGRANLLEVNPRIWGSINQGLQNGVNYFSTLLGDTPKGISTAKGETKTYLSPVLFWAFAMYLMRAQFTPLFYFAKNISTNKVDISLTDDSRGWISILLRHLLRK